MSTFTGVPDLIRRLRQEAGLTQHELAERVGTTQSVISRLERDGYEGHTLSMLVRIGKALNRSIAVTAPVDQVSTVREEEPAYGAAREPLLSSDQIEALVTRLAERFADRGVTPSDIREAIRWSRRQDAQLAVRRLSGAIRVGTGDVADDVRRARAQRGRERQRVR